MRITRIAVHQVDLPLTRPYRLSGGRLYFDRLDSTVVRIDTDEGVSGWGEGCPWGSTYLPAFPRGIRAGVDEIGPQLIGLDPRRIDVVERTMDRALPGHLYVKSAIDLACWDLLGQSTGLPVCELLGGREDEPVTIHSSIGTDTPKAMVADIAARREQGYRIHSAKVGSGVGEDLARIRALTEACPEDESVTFDVNRAWLPDQAIQVMNAIAGTPAYFEQPCDTYEQCLAVRRRTTHPVILDETIQAFGDIVRAQADGACEAIGLKIGRVGGLTKARRIRDFCVNTGLRMNIEDTGSGGIGDTAAAHLAQSTDPLHRRATWLCHDMLSVAMVDGGARNEHGTTRAPDAPGLGVTPRAEALGDPVAVFEE